MCAECDAKAEPIQHDDRFDELLKPWGDGIGWDGPVTRKAAEYLGDVLRIILDRDPIIIETGVERGFLTRRLVPDLTPNSLYWCYQSDLELRNQMMLLDYWTENLNACLKEAPTPDHREMEVADLVILNSPPVWREAELRLWIACSKPDSFLFTQETDRVEVPRATIPLGGQDYVVYGNS